MVALTGPALRNIATLVACDAHGAITNEGRRVDSAVAPTPSKKEKERKKEKNHKTSSFPEIVLRNLKNGSRADASETLGAAGARC